MKQPKLGDREALPACRDCGAKQWKVYEEKSGYQGNEYSEWEHYQHEDPADCIRSLAARLGRLEMERDGNN